MLRFVPVKVFLQLQPNYGRRTALAQAIRWAAGDSVSGVPTNSNPADIINLSLGTTADSQTIQNAVNEAQSRGALLIAAAGNDGGDILYPAKYTLGSSQWARSTVIFSVPAFSNAGSALDVVAAGGDGFLASSSCDGRAKEAVLSTIPNNSYGTLVGTSQAAPLVSGVAALIWSDDPSLSAGEVESALKASAYKTSSMTSNQYGAGVVRADVAFGYPEPGRPGQRDGGRQRPRYSEGFKADGSTESFTLENLAAGSYTVEAEASADKSLSASQRVTLSSGERESVTLQLKP